MAAPILRHRPELADLSTWKLAESEIGVIYKHRLFAPSKAAAPLWPITAPPSPCRPWPPPPSPPRPPLSLSIVPSPSLLSLFLHPLYLYQTTTTTSICLSLSPSPSRLFLSPSFLASPNCPTVSLLIVSQLFSSTFSHSTVLPHLALQAPHYYPAFSLFSFNTPLREIPIIITVFSFHSRS